MKGSLRLEIGKSFFLRVLKKKDVTKDYVNWLNDYEVTKYTEQKYKKHTFKNVEQFVLQKFKSKNDFLFEIFFNKKHIGNIKLGPISWEHKSADISYFIGNKNYWGKNIGTMVVKRVVKFALNHLSLEKINTGYYSLNVSSAKLLKKSGFKIEGKKIKNVIFENKRVDFIIVGYLKKSK